MTEYQRELVASLMRQLFEPEARQHRKQINKLIDENSMLLGQITDGFNYLGEVFGIDGQVVPSFAASLHVSLMPRMARLIHFRKTVELERQWIAQVLLKMIHPCRTSEEIRDALPECLVAFEPYLASLPRTREPAWTIRDNRRDMQQYLKILPKIETYCAMRFLY